MIDPGDEWNRLHRELAGQGPRDWTGWLARASTLERALADQGSTSPARPLTPEQRRKAERYREHLEIGEGVVPENAPPAFLELRRRFAEKFVGDLEEKAFLSALKKVVADADSAKAEADRAEAEVENLRKHRDLLDRYLALLDTLVPGRTAQ